MSHYGIIFTAYQCGDLIPASLNPWVEARAARLGGHTFTICAVSVPFVGFDHGGVEEDSTRAQLDIARNSELIDHVIASNTPMKETEARGAALRWLVERGVTATWQVDADEVYVQADIARIIAFVEASPWIMSFRLSLRNAVFDEHSYLAEPFQPMRIHRTHGPGGHVAEGFYDDNNVFYTRPWERNRGTCPEVGDISMASLTIPPEVAWPVHLSWLDNQRSKAKIQYQLEGRGWPECSFRWDEAKGLQFNEAYYARRGLPLPEVLHD